MALENLSGKWVGQYTYGEGYDAEFIGRSVPFVMDLQDDGFVVSGTCVDEETRHLLEKPASIEGAYDNGFISFLLKYPCLITIDEYMQIKSIENESAEPVHYTGNLMRALFSRSYSFEGEWDITSSYREADGSVCYYTCRGTWSMKLKR